MRIHHFYYNRRIMYNLKQIYNDDLNNILKKYEAEILKKYKKEIDKLLKILDEVGETEIDVVRYEFTHTFDRKGDNIVIKTIFSLTIHTKNALSMFKVFPIIIKNIDEIEDLKLNKNFIISLLNTYNKKWHNNKGRYCASKKFNFIN